MDCRIKSGNDEIAGSESATIPDQRRSVHAAPRPGNVGVNFGGCTNVRARRTQFLFFASGNLGGAIPHYWRRPCHRNCGRRVRHRARHCCGDGQWARLGVLYLGGVGRCDSDAFAAVKPVTPGHGMMNCRHPPTGPARSGRPDDRLQLVGWVEHLAKPIKQSRSRMMGFALLNPSYNSPHFEVPAHFALLPRR